MTTPKYTLANGVRVPVIALGTALTDSGAVAQRCIEDAVEIGYRSIDTAEAYNNQDGIGAGIKSCGVKREELYITSKVWNDNHGFEKTLKSFDNTLKTLGIDYLDQFLIHWPGYDDSCVETWHALEKLYREGLVRVIGVSNFKVHHLKRIIYKSDTMPMVDQLELNPVYVQTEEVAFCQRNEIQVEAWRPICWGKLDGFEIMRRLAEKYGKTTTQIAIRWHIQSGIRVLPKSVRKERMQENFDVFDFNMNPYEIAQINALNTGVSQSRQDPDYQFDVVMPIITE